MILKASKGIIENNNHNVIYDTPKFKPSCRPHGMVLISALDRKMAVSYTHLDVYKRQPRWRAR